MCDRKLILSLHRQLRAAKRAAEKLALLKNVGSLAWLRQAAEFLGKMGPAARVAAAALRSQRMAEMADDMDELGEAMESGEGSANELNETAGDALSALEQGFGVTPKDIERQKKLAGKHPGYGHILKENKLYVRLSAIVVRVNARLRRCGKCKKSPTTPGPTGISTPGPNWRPDRPDPRRPGEPGDRRTAASRR